jgi:arylsulfatase
MAHQPNIVLITWDSVRADHVPIYGYSRNTTPTLTAIADDGLVFEDAQVPAVGTPASFTGMFAGLHGPGSMERPYPNHWQQATANLRLLPEALQEAGYHTGGFHFNALMSSQFGWNRGWDVYEDHMWTEGDDEGIESGWKKSVYELLQRANLANFAVDAKRMAEGRPPAKWEAMWHDVAAFVETAPEPFFLWVLLIDTHHPYYAPKEYHEWPQPGVRTTYALNYVMRRYHRLVGERRESIVNAYDNTIRYADAFLDRLIEKLDDEGYADVPVVVHSDHGDEFGEHANYGHRPLMYDTVTRVPFVMANVGETGRVAGPTSLLDLGSTVLDLAGVDERLGNRPSLLGEERKERDHATVQNVMEDGDRMVAAVGPEWKVLYHPAGDWGAKSFAKESWEAYHRPSDPRETDNRWGEHPAALETALRNQLTTEVTDVAGDEEALGAGTEQRLRELGYID